MKLAIRKGDTKFLPNFKIFIENATLSENTLKTNNVIIVSELILWIVSSIEMRDGHLISPMCIQTHTQSHFSSLHPTSCLSLKFIKSIKTISCFLNFSSFFFKNIFLTFCVEVHRKLHGWIRGWWTHFSLRI